MSATTTVATAIVNISQIFMIKSGKAKSNGPPGEKGGRKNCAPCSSPRRLSIVPQSRDRLQAVYARTRLRGNGVNRLENRKRGRDVDRNEAARLAENAALEVFVANP